MGVLDMKSTNKPNKIKLTAEKKTLLLTLYAKAIDYNSKNSILKDKKAYEIASAFDYDPKKLNEFGHNEITVVRAKQLDDWIEHFIKAHKNCVVLNLGCGLDSRVTRIKPHNGVIWFDVDYPEVIKLRKNFYSDNNRYHMISSSIIKQKWLEKIPKNQETMIVAEGVLEYIAEPDVKTLLNRLTERFSHGEIAFDVMNSFAVKMGRKELKRTMGAEHKWAVDNVNDVDKMDPDLKRIEVLSVFESKYMRKVPVKYDMFHSSVKLVPHLRNLMRLLHYKF
jgi:O-methyltransferase involved in polyketide biosynthesis